MVQQNLGLVQKTSTSNFCVVDHRYVALKAHFDEWRDKLKVLVSAAHEKQYDTVLRDAPVILAMYPEYVDEASIYEFIADADKARGDSKAEAAILTAYENQGGQTPEMLKRLATLEESQGQTDDAVATLERLGMYTPEKDEELHHRMGDLLLRRSNTMVQFANTTLWRHQIL